MAAGPTGPTGPTGPNFFSADALRNLGKHARDASSSKPTDESGEVSDSSALSDAAKGLPITKDEKMLQAMKAELSQLDPNSETFLEEATEKLIDSVIEQEYGEAFKGKPGYENLQEKLVNVILSNPETKDAVEEFYDLLLEIKERQKAFEREEREGEDEEDEYDEESYEEDEESGEYDEEYDEESYEEE